MKHSHLRHEKNCLNCGATVTDRYCSHCGQENTDPKESFTHLLKHFFEDVTHYDSQVLTTVKDLVLRPGFLTKAYNNGKRLSYLNPIRMYIFISAVFFIIAFWNAGESEGAESPAKTEEIIGTYREHLADSLRRAAAGLNAVSDSTRKEVLRSLASRVGLPEADDTTESVGASFNNGGVINFHFGENKYASVKQYDEEQQRLRPEERNGRIGTFVTHKMIRLTREQGRREVDVSSNVSHDSPKLMFILLPLFALYVSFFFSRKQYTYSQHAIFSLHFHCFVFLLFIVSGLLSPDFGSARATVIYLSILLAGIFVYLTMAVRNVYQQGWGMALLKSFTISLLYLISLVLALMIFIAVKFALI